MCVCLHQVATSSLAGTGGDGVAVINPVAENAMMGGGGGDDPPDKNGQQIKEMLAKAADKTTEDIADDSWADTLGDTTSGELPANLGKEGTPMPNAWEDDPNQFPPEPPGLAPPDESNQACSTRTYGLPPDDAAAQLKKILDKLGAKTSPQPHMTCPDQQGSGRFRPPGMPPFMPIEVDTTIHPINPVEPAHEPVPEQEQEVEEQPSMPEPAGTILPNEYRNVHWRRASFF